MAKNALIKRLHQEAKEMADEAMYMAAMRRLDYTMIALGRLGMDKEFLGKFYKTLCEVEDEYNEIFLDDFHNDKDYWYSHKRLDDAVHEYCGDEYPSLKERYKLKD